MDTNHLGIPEYDVPPALQEEIDRLVADKGEHGSPEAHDKAQERHELNVASVSAYRWPHQDELAKIRLGRIMHENELLRLLRTINSSFWYNPTSVRGFRGLNVIHNGQFAYCGAVQCGLAPEYSTMRFDDHGLPTREMYRGWRTVILKLIFQGVITEEEADRVFGKAEGPEAGRHNRQLWEHRNKRAWVGQ